MSAYTCPGCGWDAPLSARCANCEHSETRTVEGMAKRLSATRTALRESLEQAAGALAELLTAREELEVSRNQVAYLQDADTRIRRELFVANRRRQGESANRLRARAELRVLRERLAEYERPVDDKELGEVIYRVEAEHAVFAAAERGEEVKGFAAWCGSCDSLILAIRKMAAAARPATGRATMLGRSVKTCADRVGRVIDQPVDRSAPAGSEFLQIPAHSVGTIVQASATTMWAEFALYDRKLIAEFRLGDVEVLPVDEAAAP